MKARKSLNCDGAACGTTWADGGAVVLSTAALSIIMVFLVIGVSCLARKGGMPFDGQEYWQGTAGSDVLARTRIRICGQCPGLFRKGGRLARSCPHGSACIPKPSGAMQD